MIEAWPEALIGDEVVIYGDGAVSATDLGEAIGTIGEEIALRVSPLIAREYRERLSQDSIRRDVSSCQLVAMARSFSSYLRPW